VELRINKSRLIKNTIITKRYLKIDTNSTLTLYLFTLTHRRKGRIMIKNGFNKIEKEMKRLPILLFKINLSSFLKK